MTTALFPLSSYPFALSSSANSRPVAREEGRGGQKEPAGFDRADGAAFGNLAAGNQFSRRPADHPVEDLEAPLSG
jgi:hypothetical protein